MLFAWREHLIELTRKPIKHLYLRISREGLIRVSAPKAMPDQIIQQFLDDKADWIQSKVAKASNLAQRQWRDGEAIAVLGADFRLGRAVSSQPRVVIKDQIIWIPEGTAEQMSQQLEQFYRTILTDYLAKQVPYWADRMQLYPNEWRVRRMKTRWGSCNFKAKRLWFRLELAKCQPELIDYVIVHELAHLYEPGHNQRFYQKVADFLPDWAERRRRLNHTNLD